jgi:hypothetical protein
MPTPYDSELAKKLNLKSGMAVHLIGAPADLDLSGLARSDSDDGGGVIVFARTVAELDATVGSAVAAARADHIAWIAYPKGGRLGTDLNRDILWKHMAGNGIRPVRQVALDDTWSALRFRPAR